MSELSTTDSQEIARCIVARTARRFWFFGERVERYLRVQGTDFGALRQWVPIKEQATGFRSYQEACRHADRQKD